MPDINTKFFFIEVIEEVKLRHEVSISAFATLNEIMNLSMQ